MQPELSKLQTPTTLPGRLKISVLFFFCLALIMIISGALFISPFVTPRHSYFFQPLFRHDVTKQRRVQQEHPVRSLHAKGEMLPRNWYSRMQR